MTREEAIRIFRKEIECMSHTKCSDCILEKACDPISTTPLDSEYIEAFGMAIEALSAEPCDDAISRQVVLDVIEREMFKGDAISEIEKLPSVTPKQKMGRWIPVSERLPEKYKEVIVTDIETNDTYQSRYVGNGYWECDNGLFTNRIIAWMPLPEPMKVGEANC